MVNLKEKVEAVPETVKPRDLLYCPAVLRTLTPALETSENPRQVELTPGKCVVTTQWKVHAGFDT